MGKRQASQEQLQLEAREVSVFEGVDGAIALPEIGVKAELWYTFWQILEKYIFTLEAA